MTSYSFTASAFSGSALFAVTADGVASVCSGVATIIAFADIASVQLAYAPSRVDPARHRCDILGSRGRSIRVFSTSFVGLGNFEDQADAYREVVLALHRGLAHRAPAVRFVGGVSRLRYALNVGAVLLALPILWFALFAFGSSIGVPAALHLLLLVVLLPLVWRWLRRNRPATYTADAIPAALLPAASGASPASASNAR